MFKHRTDQLHRKMVMTQLHNKSIVPGLSDDPIQPLASSDTGLCLDISRLRETEKTELTAKTSAGRVATKKCFKLTGCTKNYTSKEQSYLCTKRSVHT